MYFKQYCCTIAIENSVIKCLFVGGFFLQEAAKVKELKEPTSSADETSSLLANGTS